MMGLCSFGWELPFWYDAEQSQIYTVTNKLFDYVVWCSCTFDLGENSNEENSDPKDVELQVITLVYGDANRMDGCSLS